MPDNFVSLLGQLSAGQDLSAAQMTDAMNALMSGECDEGQTGLFLTALSAKGETAEEVAGAAHAMRAHMTPIRHGHPRLLDTCGTGGGGSDVFNVSTAAVSKRLSALEQRLGVALLHRTTRRMGLTPEGEVYLRHARRILADLAELEQQVAGSRATPAGLLRVNATLGFGRSRVAPALSRFVRKYPEVEVQLQLSVNPPPLKIVNGAPSGSPSASTKSPWPERVVTSAR